MSTIPPNAALTPTLLRLNPAAGATQPEIEPPSPGLFATDRYEVAQASVQPTNIPSGGPTLPGRGQRRVDNALRDMQQTSHLFNAMTQVYSGEVQVRDLRDYAYNDAAGNTIATTDAIAGYNPHSNVITIDTDNARHSSMRTLKGALAEEYAHRYVSRAILDANPGMDPGAVRNKVNEVVAKTYAELSMMQAGGRPIDDTAINRAVDAAFKDVAANYGSYPDGYYESMLSSFFGQVDAPYEGSVRNALTQRFRALGWPPRPE